MLHYWKSGKHKIAYDTASGAVVSLTSLEYKMIQTITPPLAPLCPSSLRYELAKYDSADVEEAYDKLYQLFSSGILFANVTTPIPRVRIGGQYGLKDADGTAQEILSLLGSTSPEWIVDKSADEETAASIRALR